MDNCDILSSVVPYASLSEAFRQELLETLQCRDYQAGDVLISESAWINHVGFIVSGQADAFLGYQTDSQIAAFTLHPFDFFGDLASMTERRSPVSVVCRKDTRVFRQTYEAFARFMALEPALKAHFSQTALEKLWHLFKIMRSGGGAPTINDLPDSRIPAPIQKAVKYIDTHYGETITVDCVIRKIGMSRSSFSRQFKHHIGVSFKTYLNHTRVSRAKHLISREGLNVTEACFAVGFNDTAYFSRAFRKIEGCSPSQHKRSGQVGFAPMQMLNPLSAAVQQRRLQ